MAGLELLAKYNVDLSDALNPSNLPKLRKTYVSLVDSLKSTSQAADAESESLLSQLTQSVANVADVKSSVASLKSDMLQMMYDAIEANSDVVIPLVEALQEVKSAAMVERDYQVSRVKRDLSPSKPTVDADFVERREEAEALAELVRNLWTLLKSDALAADKDFRKGFPLKEQQEGKGDDRHGTGEFIPDLPNLPRLPGETSVAVGRNASHRQMRFAWNGDNIPAGTFVTDVAHDYVSDRKSGFVVDHRALVDAVEKSGSKFASEEPWEIEFPTGTLRGWLPKKEQ